MNVPGLDDATSAARRAGDHPVVETGARIGYAANGLMHLLIAFIAVRLAMGGKGASADQSGALGVLKDLPGGSGLLWVCVAGFVLLGLWQLTELAARFEDTGDRVKAGAKAVVYLVLAWTAAQFATGSGTSSSGQARGFASSLMSSGLGRAVIVAIGLVVLGVGGYHVYKGAKQKFLEDLAERPPQAAVYAGVAGYVAKGLALGIVGILFCVAGIQGSSKQAGGLDTALRTLQQQPFGTPLLVVVGLGIALYGLYSFARARYAKV